MTSRKPLILAIDDDPGILRLMRRTLEMEGYRVLTAVDGETALRLVENESPTLLILDVMMTGLDGFEVCQRVREFSNVSIMMLSARDKEEDVVHAINVGADDYVAKPFSIDEMLARVKALLRRTTSPEELIQAPFRCDGLCIDFTQRRVTINGTDLHLTPKEYRTLCLLAHNADSIVTHDRLLAEVWGWEYRGSNYMLRDVIARLRRKMKDDPERPRYILTRRDFGYGLKKVACTHAWQGNESDRVVSGDNVARD